MKTHFNAILYKASQSGNLKDVCEILSRPDFKNSEYKNAAFINACRNGHLEIVKYFLTSPELKRAVNIAVKDNDGIIAACENGHIKVVKYLLTSMDLKKHADIHARGDECLVRACRNGHLEVVRYLLTSSDLIDHSTYAIIPLLYSCQSHNEILNFLFYDMKMQISPEIKENLKPYLSREKYEEVLSLLDKRELFFSLNSDLNDKQKNVTKIKL